MFCTKCGQKLEGNESAFCSNCGTKLETAAQKLPSMAQQQSSDSMAKQPLAGGIFKNKIMLVIAIAIIVGGALFFFIGNLGGGNPEDLVGFWVSPFSTLELRADGTGTRRFYNDVDHYEFSGAYDFEWEIDGGKFVETVGLGSPSIVNYKLRGDELTIDPVEYTRE